MSPEDRKEARSYAWGYFMVHADQRMKLFNFFLILSGLILAAFSAVRGVAQGTRLPAILPLFLTLSAFTFWRLDERTRMLIKNAEEALRFLDTQWSVDCLHLVEQDDYLTAEIRKRWWADRVIPISYTASFRVVYVMVAAVGLGLATWVWLAPNNARSKAARKTAGISAVAARSMASDPARWEWVLSLTASGLTKGSQASSRVRVVAALSGPILQAEQEYPEAD